MYDLTDFQSYQDYFKAIAQSHVGFVDDGFIFGDDDATVNEGTRWKNKKLWLEPYQPVTITDQQSDNYLIEKKGSLWVGGAPSSDKFEEKHAFFKECEDIVRDIIAKMLRDRTDEVLITRLTSYKFGMGQFNFGASNLVGCRFDFTFWDPSGFAYDTNKWQ